MRTGSCLAATAHFVFQTHLFTPLFAHSGGCLHLYCVLRFTKREKTEHRRRGLSLALSFLVSVFGFPFPLTLRLFLSPHVLLYCLTYSSWIIWSFLYLNSNTFWYICDSVKDLVFSVSLPLGDLFVWLHFIMPVSNVVIIYNFSFIL